MSKSKSHPCQHPQAAVSCDGDVEKKEAIFHCKKCNLTWREQVAPETLE